MIVAASVMPLVGAVMCLVMALLITWTTPGHKSLRALSFIAMNLGIALWGLGTFVLANISGGVGIEAARFGTAEYWVFAVMVTGLHASAIYWFIFSASFTGHDRYTTRTALAWLHGVLAAGTLLALSNPWHHLYGRPLEGELVYGVSWIAISLLLYALIVAGAVFLSTSPARTLASRRQARIAAAAALLPAFGAVVWNLRRVLGLDISVNPAPMMFAFFAVIMGYLVFIRGFAGISANAAELAFRHSSDALVATDLDLRVMSVNESAARLLGDLQPGALLDEAWPELALIARECHELDAEAVPFEIRREGMSFQGRAEGMRARTGGFLGCVIALTDVTELQIATEALARLQVSLRD